MSHFWTAGIREINSNKTKTAKLRKSIDLVVWDSLKVLLHQRSFRREHLLCFGTTAQILREVLELAATWTCWKWHPCQSIHASSKQIPILTYFDDLFSAESKVEISVNIARVNVHIRVILLQFLQNVLQSFPPLFWVKWGHLEIVWN